jgi:hypothetical protein
MTTAHDERDRRTLIRHLISRQPADLDLLRRICLALVDALTASGSGISVMTADGTLGVCVGSDPVSERVEELQFVLGEGPRFDAFADRRPVLVADLAGESSSRWPLYAPAAQEEDVRAVFAFPLQVGAVRLGVVDVFRERVGPLSGTELQMAFTFTEVIVETLLDMRQSGVSRDPGGGAVLDVGRRAELFQAQGMVMMQLGVSIGEALVRMRAYAYAENRRLEDVARDVVERRLRWDEDKV